MSMHGCAQLYELVFIRHQHGFFTAYFSYFLSLCCVYYAYVVHIYDALFIQAMHLISVFPFLNMHA